MNISNQEELDSHLEASSGRGLVVELRDQIFSFDVDLKIVIDKQLKFDEINFSGSEFKGIFNASNVVFPGVFRAKDTVFHKYANFDNSVFRPKDVDIANVRLRAIQNPKYREIWFNEENDAVWENPMPGEYCCWFDSSEFREDASFVRCRFYEAAWFGNTRFFKRAKFTNAIFEGPSRFIKVYCGPSFCISASAKNGEPDPMLTMPRANFRNSTFRGSALFNGRKFAEAVDFRDTSFEYPAEFHGVEFAREISFRNIAIEKIDDRNAERNIRGLRRELDRKEEPYTTSYLLWREMQSAWEARRIDFPTYCFSYLYNTFSRFGRSASRPLVFYILLQVGFFFELKYVLFGTPANPAGWAQTAAFFFKEISNPLNVITETRLPDFVKVRVQAEPWVGVLRTFSTYLQGVFTIVMVGLFVNALRKRFPL